MIEATLADDFGHRGRVPRDDDDLHRAPAGTGSAVEFIGRATNPFLATVGLRVEPGDGVAFRLEVELGSMPFAFFKAVEETVFETLRALRRRCATAP